MDNINASELYYLACEQMNNEDIDNYCSDLYLRRNAISTSLISRYENNKCVKTFKCNISGQIWYDIPFAFILFYMRV